MGEGPPDGVQLPDPVPPVPGLVRGMEVAHDAGDEVRHHNGREDGAGPSLVECGCRVPLSARRTTALGEVKGIEPYG